MPPPEFYTVSLKAWRELVYTFPFPYNDMHFKMMFKRFNYWFLNISVPELVAYLYGGSMANYLKYRCASVCVMKKMSLKSCLCSQESLLPHISL